jgi:hypothetical protein
VGIGHHQRIDREVVGGRRPPCLVFLEFTHVVFNMLLQLYKKS